MLIISLFISQTTCIPEYLIRPDSGVTPYYSKTNACDQIPWIVVHNLLLLDISYPQITAFISKNYLTDCPSLTHVLSEVQTGNPSALLTLLPPTAVDCGSNGLPYKVATRQTPVHVCLDVTRSLDKHVIKTGYWHDCLTLSELLKDVRFSSCGHQRPCLYVDVGANVGVCALQLGHEGHEVIAFEPDAEAFDIFSRSLGLNDLNISLFNAALDEKAGTANLTKINDNSGGATIVKSALRPAPHNADEGHIQVVVTTTIDQFFHTYPVEAIDLLKLDVEQAEFAVLKGAARTLEAGVIRVIIFEVTKSMDSGTVTEMLKFLNNFGYEIYFAPWHQGVWILAEESDYGNFHQLPEINPNFLAIRTDIL